MDANDKLDKLLEGVAGLNAKVENLNSYIGAVSGNGKQIAQDLQRHVENNEAHGLDVREKSSGSMAGWIAIAIAGATAVMDALKNHR